jgi:hypothetical protein
MQVFARSIRREPPESLIHRLAARLRRQALWDSLLLFVPPAAALIWLFVVLLEAAWLSQKAVALAGVIVIALSAVAVVLRRRPLVSSVRYAAGLMDQRAGAKDHFLTLATVEPGKQPEALIARLRGQAEQFRDRVELKRDFPYRPKPSAYWSLAGSLIAAMVVYFLLPVASPLRDLAAAPERLRDAAKQLAAKPEFRALAKELEALAARLEDPNVSVEEKQASAQRLEEKIQEEQKKAQPEDNRDLLEQAASAVGGQEQQQASGGQQQKQQKGSGGIQTNAPQQGQGETQQSQGGGGDGKGESTAQSNQGMDPGKSSKTKPDQPGRDKNSSGEAKNNQTQPDPDRPDPSKSDPGKTQGGVKEGGGKQQASAEPPPQGGSPAERFYKPGEGKDGIKGAGYVTVQLPEEVVADAKGESRATKDPKNARTRTQVPVSNVPLPAHVPNAPTEKQPLPIEYRDIIR